MKISDDTLSILNNFSSINGSILINEGSELNTIAASKNILAKASVDETFPKQFGIYELNEFLSAISLLDDPSFNFNGEHVIVEEETSRKSIKYNYTDPALILTAPNDGIVEFPEPELSFVLTENDLKSIKKAAGVLALPHVCIKPLGDGLVVNVTDMAKGSSSNGFELDIDISNDDTVFSDDLLKNLDDYCVTFTVDNLKMCSGDYTVHLSVAGIGHFINRNIDLEYWIASETQYSVNYK